MTATCGGHPAYNGALAYPAVLRICRYMAIALVAASIIFFSGFFQKVHAADQDGAGARQLARDPDFRPRLGTYHYYFEYNGINLGTAWVSIAREAECYRMEVFARTSDTVDHVYRIRYRGVNITGADPLSPLETRIQQTVKSNEKDIVMRFQQSGRITTTQKQLENQVVVDGTVRNYNSGRVTVDPFSATYLARGLDWRPGLEQVFEVYNGKRCYELTLKCTGRTTLDTPAGNRVAWVIVPSARQIEDDGRRVELKKKPSSLKIYLSADDLKDVLRIEATHAIGSFLVLLDRFEPETMISIDS